jgi:cohesin complex subunit SCC1
MNRDNSDILGEERYISADPRMIRLRQIMEDPTGHFLPNVKNGGDNMFYAGPQDLAPELAELFTFPSNILRKRPEEGEQDDRQAKRARTEAEDEIEDPEVGRRMTLAPSERGQSGFPGDDFVVPPMEIEPPLDHFDPNTNFTPGPEDRLRTPSVAPSIAPSNAEIFNQRSTGDHMLAMFEKPEKEQGESQSQTTPQKSVISEPISRTSSGYSKNTGMAMGLLQRELEAIEEEDKVIGLEKIAEKVSLCSGQKREVY